MNSNETTLDKFWVDVSTVVGKSRQNDELKLNTVNFEVNSVYQDVDGSTSYVNRIENYKRVNPPVIKEDFSLIDSRRYFTQAQRWIGTVISHNSLTFSAKLTDLNDPTTYEIGEFDLDEVSPEDFDLIRDGAIFYWSIGKINNYGQVEKKSLIRFQRVFVWKIEDFNDAIDSANTNFRTITWE